MYEAVHGTAPDIAGKNLANPTALLLSGIMVKYKLKLKMLRAMEMRPQADQIEAAAFKVLEQGKYVTRDLGGKSGTTEFTKAVIGSL